jgi:hypothetical protein
MNDRPFTERAYEALVAMYPRRFRDEYGADMVLLFRNQCGDEPTWRVCVRCVIDLALTIPNQHLETHMRRNPSPTLTLVYLTFALAGAVLAVIGGSAPIAVVIGITIALGAGALAILTWRRAAPFRESNLTGQWWKFLVAGPALLAAVIVAARLGVEAWFVGLAIVIAAIAMVAIGIVLGLARVVTHRSPTHA